MIARYIVAAIALAIALAAGRPAPVTVAATPLPSTAPGDITSGGPPGH
jgi:hypothetical protein